MIRLADAALRRNARSSRLTDEDGAALVSTLVFMVILTGVSFVLLSVLLGQIVPSYSAQKNTRTVYAAQAGLQAGLGLLRSAAAETADSSGRILGDPGKLPCDFDGQLDGEEDGDVRYSVKVTYFSEDPTGKDEAWREAADLPCSAGVGVSVQSGPGVQPSYAVVSSEGIAADPIRATTAAGERRLEAVYEFRLTNINIAGGRIWTTDKKRCLEATGTTAPSEAKLVPAAECTSEKDGTQLWINDATYQIKLASTTVARSDGIPPVPICITGPTNAGDRAQLMKCETTDVRWNQLWSWIGGEKWQGQKKNIKSGPSNYCLSAGSEYLEVKTSCTSLAPEAAVGSGAASFATKQIVNYKEFGRCADVTDEKIDSKFMITYPCKQDPGSADGLNLKWNHKWYYTEPAKGVSELADQQITVNVGDDPKKMYCLQSTNGKSGPRYVTFEKCNSGSPQRWTRQNDTGDYRTSYRFVDSWGRCLEADASQPFSSVASKLTVKDCNGSEAQKWNAPPNANGAKFGGFKETSG